MAEAKTEAMFAVRLRTKNTLSLPMVLGSSRLVDSIVATKFDKMILKQAIYGRQNPLLDASEALCIPRLLHPRSATTLERDPLFTF